MNDEEKLISKYNCSIRIDRDGRTVYDGEQGNIKIYADYAVVSFENAEMPVDYIDIDKLENFDYKTVITVTGSGQVILSAFGLHYEDFCRDIVGSINRCLKTYLLMDEKITGFKTIGHVESTLGGMFLKSRSEIIFTENGIVILPDLGKPSRMPIAVIESVEKDNHQIKMTTITNESVIFSMLGKDFDPFVRELNKVNDLIIERSIEQLLFLKEKFEDRVVNQIAALMKDGRGVSKQDIDKLDRKLFVLIAEYISRRDKDGKMKTIFELCCKDDMLIGLKRGLIGDLTGGYIWVLAARIDEAAKTVYYLFEAFSSEEKGMATYIFRTSIEDYEEGKMLKIFNNALLMINFRREPIYISEGQLSNKTNKGYRYAVNNIPGLPPIRDAFVSRVVFTDRERWVEAIYKAINLKKEI